MKVTKQNYERFLIDFMDGTIDPSTKESLFDFLDENPKIKAEFNDLDIINTAVDEDISFELKANLKKTQITSSPNIHGKNYEEFFIASTEGDLTIAEEKELGEFMAVNPSLKKEQQLYKQSKAQPDLSIQYPHKKALQKYPFIIQHNWYSKVSIAASILLLLGIFLFTKSDERITQREYAQLEERMPVPEKIKAVSENISIPTASISTELHAPNHKSIATPTLANLQNFIIADEQIQRLHARINITEQVAALQPQFRPTRYIFRKNVNYQFNPILNSEQINYADEEGDGKKHVFKAIWNSVFSVNKNSENKKSSDDNFKKVGPLWVLANIGLERVNEVTGTNMRLNSRADEGKSTTNGENAALEKTRSLN